MSTKGGGSATPEDRYKGLVCFKLFFEVYFSVYSRSFTGESCVSNMPEWKMALLASSTTQGWISHTNIIHFGRGTPMRKYFQILYRRSDSPVCPFTTISCIPSLIRSKKSSFITSDMPWQNFPLAILQAPYPPICGIRWTLKNWAVQNWN